MARGCHKWPICSPVCVGVLEEALGTPSKFATLRTCIEVDFRLVVHMVRAATNVSIAYHPVAAAVAESRYVHL